MDDWTIVIPVKGTAAAKSRLSASPELALALAVDTVVAALAVARVVVVTASAVAGTFKGLGATVVPDPGTGLNAAVGAGLRVAGPGPVAVLLGDLPALLPGELAATLSQAEEHPLAMVPDTEGAGTVLLTAGAGMRHSPSFGPSSGNAHLALGYVELRIPADSGLRRDVDTAQQLAELASAGRLGPRTSSRLR